MGPLWIGFVCHANKCSVNGGQHETLVYGYLAPNSIVLTPNRASMNIYQFVLQLLFCRIVPEGLAFTPMPINDVAMTLSLVVLPHYFW